MYIYICTLSSAFNNKFGCILQKTFACLRAAFFGSQVSPCDIVSFVSLLGAAMGSEPEGEPGQPKVDLTGLALELEREDAIREFFRENKGPLFKDDMTVETVKAVQEDHHFVIIRNLLHRAALVEGHPSPTVASLREELASLYQRCSVVVGDDAIHTDAWSVRKILAFVKMKVRRGKVSTATQTSTAKQIFFDLLGFSFLYIWIRKYQSKTGFPKKQLLCSRFFLGKW